MLDAKVQIKHRIKELIDSAPKNTTIVKKELAEKLGVHITTVHRYYVDDSVQIELPKALLIAEYFGVKPEEILQA